MIVREAGAGDVDDIEAVARASWETDYPAILSRETAREGVEEWYGADRLAAEIESDDALVPVADGEAGVVGFAHAVAEESDGTILRLYVAPDHRREGVGGDLLDHTREALIERGVERVRAMVLAANDPGNEFYRRHGFKLAAESGTVIAGTSYEENVYVAER